MNHKTVLEDLPKLRKELSQTATYHPYKVVFIGKAISYLSLLEDILREKDTKDN